MSWVEKAWWKCGAWVFLLIAPVLIVVAIHFRLAGYILCLQPGASADSKDISGMFLSLAGWTLTFAGILFAGRHAWRGWMLNALLKLHEDEGSGDQGKAKGLIGEAADKCPTGANPYRYAWEYRRGLGKGTGKYNEFDDARRRLAHFWLRAVKLVDWGVLDEKELFNNFEPDILEKLEPFETVVAEEWRDLSKSVRWQAGELYIAWLKQHKNEGKRREADN